jgi:hypothetical protein
MTTKQLYNSSCNAFAASIMLTTMEDQRNDVFWWSEQKEVITGKIYWTKVQ